MNKSNSNHNYFKVNPLCSPTAIIIASIWLALDSLSRASIGYSESIGPMHALALNLIAFLSYCLLMVNAFSPLFTRAIRARLIAVILLSSSASMIGFAYYIGGTAFHICSPFVLAVAMTFQQRTFERLLCFYRYRRLWRDFTLLNQYAKQIYKQDFEIFAENHDAFSLLEVALQNHGFFYADKEGNEFKKIHRPEKLTFPVKMHCSRDGLIKLSFQGAEQA